MIDGRIEVAGVWSVPISAFGQLIHKDPDLAAEALVKEYVDADQMMSMCEPGELVPIDLEAELVATVKNPRAFQANLFNDDIEPETIVVHVPLWGRK